MTIAALFLTDRRGETLLWFSVMSLLLSGSAIDTICIVSVGFDMPLPAAIASVARARGVALDVGMSRHRPPAEALSGSRITSAAHLKLVSLMDALDRYDRVLYVDTDMLFLKPLALADFDFGRRDLAAGFDVAETAGVTDPELPRNCARHGLSPDYFNSGMLFAPRSLKSRKEDLMERYRDLVAQHDERCLYKSRCGTSDQCVWNMMFQNQWAPLPVEWNVQSSMRFTDLWNRASVRHYTGEKKFIPLASWRSDTIEIEHVTMVARHLGLSMHRPRQPFDLVYKANSVRWHGGTRIMSSALREVQSRLRQMSATA